VKISGHRKIGLIGAFWLVYFSFFHFPLWSIAVSVWTFIIGNTAPDTLEFSRYDENAYFKRTSLIPHRTYTHWFLLWFLLFMISGGLTFYYHAYWLPVWAYSLGGLMHLLCDLPNPTGVPFLHPKKRRKSLNWWKNGENENIIFGKFHELRILLKGLLSRLITQGISSIGLFNDTERLFHLFEGCEEAFPLGSLGI